MSFSSGTFERQVPPRFKQRGGSCSGNMAASVVLERSFTELSAAEREVRRNFRDLTLRPGNVTGVRGGLGLFKRRVREQPVAWERCRHIVPVYCPPQIRPVYSLSIITMCAPNDMCSQRSSHTTRLLWTPVPGRSLCTPLLSVTLYSKMSHHF